MSPPANQPSATKARHAQGGFFWHLHNIYQDLKPCRFVFIVAIVGGIIFGYVEQGREVLRALAEKTGPTTVVNGSRLFLFALGLLLWSLVSWYASRTLLYFDFQAGHQAQADRTGFWSWLRPRLHDHAPRILGVLPCLFVGISFWLVRDSYNQAPPPNLLYFGVGAIVAAALLYAFFIWRRYWLIRQRRPRTSVEGATKRIAPVHNPDYERLGEMETGTLVAVAIMGAISFAVSVMFIFWPVYFGEIFGTAAVLAFAAASWAFWGSALVYIGSWKKIPVITIAIIVMAVFSLFNDNHDVRVIERKAAWRPTVADALADWNKRVREGDNTGTHPLFIITSAGGGIRAAYWTATVLGALQDADENFAKHVFAISGVSGGSLGAAVFVALVADHTPKGEYAHRAQQMLGQDFLSPAMGAMFYPDLWQRFLPIKIRSFDRGRSLEGGWEQAWKRSTGTDRFSEPFLDLWPNGEMRVPALFLNGTSVEAGHRVIQSNIRIDKDFFDSEDACGKLFQRREYRDRRNPTKDVRLSTAAHMSARFTYISPAGRYPVDGSHVVDGGYFENSGAATALDILRRVSDVMKSDPNTFQGIVPQIIRITNDPTQHTLQSDKPATRKERLKEQKQIRSLKAEPAVAKPSTFLEDVLAPAGALMKTRDARGTYAELAVAAAEHTLYHSKPHTFALGPANVPLPLGWMLSNEAARAMQQQIRDEGLAKPGATRNAKTLSDVIRLLPRAPAPATQP